MRFFAAGVSMTLSVAHGADFDCSDFGCTCHGFWDYYGAATVANARYSKGWGCADRAAQAWFKQEQCIPACINGSITECHPSISSHPGCGNDCLQYGCTCQGYMDFYGASSTGAGSRHSVGCAPAEDQRWNAIEHCDAECAQSQTGCTPSTQEYPGCNFDCDAFGCTCQGFADWFGASTGITWGCADSDARQWWTSSKCEGPGIPKIRPSTEDHPGCGPVPSPVPPAPAPTPLPPTPAFDCDPFGCTCQGFADWYGASAGETWGCASADAQHWWTAAQCDPKITASLAPGTRRGGCKCITDVSAGFHSKVPCAGLWNTFSVDYNVPEKCLSSSCGLIVDVHGFTMTGAAEDANSNIKAMGEKHGYIVVQPNAPLNNWNDDAKGATCSGIPALPNHTYGNKQSCWNAPWDKEPIGDRAINTWVQEALEVKSWNVDRNRLHFMGFSEGGWVTGRMLCNYPHIYASFSMLAGASNADPFECIQEGANFPPILVTQGYNDMSSLWRTFNAGWESFKSKAQLDKGELIDGTTHCGQQWEIFDCNDFGCTCQGFADYYGVKHLQTLGCAEGYKLRKAWHKDHACAASAQTSVHPGCDGCFSRTRHLGPSNVTVELLTHNFIGDYLLRGHCFPGSDNLHKIKGESFAFGCPGAKEVDAGSTSPFHWGEESMKFFLAHPKVPSVELV